MSIEWRTIARAPGYEVSELGEIRRAIGGQGATNGFVQKWHTCTSTGYPDARLRVEGRTLTIPVHRIVANAFLGEKPDGLQIRHLDGDKMNCRRGNLVYGTHKENQEDKVLHGTSSAGERNFRAKLTQCQVAAMRTDRTVGRSAKELALAYGVSESTVYRIVAGRYWQEASNRSMDRATA